jgi:hypothetical protein
MRKIILVALLALPACAHNVRQLHRYEIAIGPFYERPTHSFAGSLMYESGCLVFNGDNGSPRLLPIWPSGTKFVESLVTFHRPSKDDERAVLNQEIRLDGIPADWSQLDPATFGPFHQQCGWAKPFFVSGLAPAN